MDEWDEDGIWGLDTLYFVKKPTKASIIHLMAFFL
jgi:hypothetical protein